MIVRTYGRRTRSLGRTVSDPGGGAAADPFAFSSQDSSPSPWSLDPFDDSPPLFPPPLPPPPPPPPQLNNSSNGSRRAGKRAKDQPSQSKGEAAATATLMETQEFGEMMEHVDEVNFSLDGLRPGQPARIRRASLLSLLSICATAHQRRLLRAQGMAKRIIDAVLGLNFDDSPSTVAAATLFYVLASDVQDDHLLDSPLCIQFLLKLLNPPVADSFDDKLPTSGSKLLGLRRLQTSSATNKELDSCSNAIILKVQEILTSCKEIKSGNDDVGDDGRGRPELSSKWISLLTMEKACLSTVSFEDTSDTIRRSGGNFKERLRDLGGLDAIFDVMSSCHSTLEELMKCKSLLISELKDSITLQSVVLLLKCLKVLENATFLSKDNQSHLLGMKTKPSSKGLGLSFIEVIISAIKFLSELSLIQNSTPISNNKSNCSAKSVEGQFCLAPELKLKENPRDKKVGNSSSKKSADVCQNRQIMSSSQSEASVSGSGMTVASGPYFCSIKKRATHLSSLSCDGESSSLKGKSHKNANGSRVITLRGSNGWVSLKDNGSSKNLGGLCKRRRMSEDVLGPQVDSFDPFAFDGDDIQPSKWDLLASRKEPSQTRQSTVMSKVNDECQLMMITTNDELSQSIDAENHQTHENSFRLMAEEDSTLLEDCLLTAIKVLMNLTNDNPIGCQQIATFDGLDTMASLIIKHFPSFDLLHVHLRDDTSSSNLSVEADHLNHKHLSDHKLDFLVAILGLLVNLVEKDSRNRSRLASARIEVDLPGRSEGKQIYKDVIPLLCSIFLANQGAGEVAGEGGSLPYDDEASLLEGEREAEMMIVEAYAALLLAFLSMESIKVRETISSYLPNQNLQVLVPVLERFVAFHLTLNMISPETHSAVSEVIESCKGS